jgi:hypothetical protein
MVRSLGPIPAFKSIRGAMSPGGQMKTLVKAVLAVALLLTVRASSSAQTLTVNGNNSAPPGCFDGTPHKETLVTVANGVQLQVLDWGGADKTRTMVLITGLGDYAHVYDQFAFQFTDYFHVIGITRRGYLPSSQPAGPTPWAGYDFDTRAPRFSRHKQGRFRRTFRWRFGIEYPRAEIWGPRGKTGLPGCV